ncbi:tRNA uridine-5-carboxymethylaminomethyl(34) synthesis GTPase MnmE [Cognatiyoonia sp. IB215182]|uniref:tRNA uridine-5-carboxymethylaminomethyl(34) synthesis GTPase MnmE n=1 Tax=Cognatiyoonia sp. IB215182 TaxID=3097353 RepID=UPI002A0E87C5|nr:tRNA uridine-5-carboxymethylaminomethyl(34) synthesis GTPase MnmE [Cognatiyoonia sp. IB215182]MDX8353146.1 tRNA uridine-5-carboxymethylaminomethyl(34) synthesis GTPase MnmE [Cognatiyoonia sp. IB215182]
MDTVFALATARGRAGVAVIRVSGDHARASAARLMGDVPKVRGVRVLKDRAGDLLDEALILNFPKGKSFTGEDVVELHLHGSPAVVAAVLRVLGEDNDLSPAAPGEFTRRALENGRLDLAQVEGLADLIDAETESQRKQAVRVFSGGLGVLAESWRSRLIRATALLEATIDFVDEEVPVDVTPEVMSLISGVVSEMEAEAVGVGVAERLRDGFEVAIIGAPNVGKSTLLNRLAGREVAITSQIAGTTRDVIEVQMDLDGLPVTLLDTAGLRETDDVVEGIGVARAKERAEQADIRVHILDEGRLPSQDMVGGNLYFRAKSDLKDADEWGISGKTGAGVDMLVMRIGEILQGRVAAIGTAMRERHRLALVRGVEDLKAAMVSLQSQHGMTDLTAEELRSGIRAVDSLVGRVDVEHVLDEIFSSFCIGK